MITLQSSKKRRWALPRFFSQSGRNVLLVILLMALMWSCSKRDLGILTLVEQPKSIESSEQSIIMATYIFGRTASYVQMFAESARHSGIDVVIIGSPAPTFSLPPNVRHVPLMWEELVERVSTRLFEGAELPNLLNVRKYKVVDLKPFFSFLFPKEVEGYDWWGHLDNDLLLGNVRHSVTEELYLQTMT